jgi:hypothetical protein
MLAPRVTGLGHNRRVSGADGMSGSHLIAPPIGRRNNDGLGHKAIFPAMRGRATHAAQKSGLSACGIG